MLLVYRGWGGLGLGFPLLGALIGVAIAASSKLDTQFFTMFAGIGAIAGGVGAYLLGTRLNTTGPQRKLVEFENQRRAQLQQLVNEGQFQVAPGAPVPSSIQEGYSQAEFLLTREVEDVKKAASNNHTLYGIPMQWFGLIGAGIGIAVLISGFATGAR